MNDNREKIDLVVKAIKLSKSKYEEKTKVQMLLKDISIIINDRRLK